MDEHDIQEVLTESTGGEPLQESVLSDAAFAFGGVSAFASAGAAYYQRAQYLLARHDRNAELRAQRDELDTARLAFELERRQFYAEAYGLDAPDGFGVEDDEFRGFGVE